MDLGIGADGGSALAEVVADNDITMATNTNENKPEEDDIDPIWLSSRTARQIYGLCQVEKVSIRYHHPSPYTRYEKIARRLTVDVFLFIVKGYWPPAFPRCIVHLPFDTTPNGPSRSRLTTGCRAVRTVCARS